MVSSHGEAMMEEGRIKEIRMRLGISQERFAQLLSVSLQTVRRWESGLTRPLPIIRLKLEEMQREARAPESRTVDSPMRGTNKIKGQAELGLGGMFKGIGSLVDLVSKMAEEGAEETTRTGEVEG